LYNFIFDVDCFNKVIMNKNEILQCLDLSDWSEDSSPEGSDDSDEDIIFEVSNLLLFLILCPTVK